MTSALLTATLLVVVVACTRAEPESSGRRDSAATTPVTPSGSPAPSPAPSSAPPTKPSAPPEPGPEADVAQREPLRSFISIPPLGLRDVPVERYRGTPDDAPGTELQDRGAMASPRGPGGGVGSGVVGNFIVTGHRTSHGAPLRELPALDVGARVLVRSGERALVYRITRTRSTSFRSPSSLASQSAPVPGRPGVAPSRSMLTLSTCATPEDRAVGNYWSDEHGNPEHRIDKIGVLERVRPVG